ncbi:MAG TPA: selenite/tellurite reduction operon porin ExtI [Thiobacillaceae bacterium]|nr:selenite/tellurite reduction operon porin ExtI [Thiobacillaceae bacterium]HNU63988.1 selenite/tellurite reduction operon porin ExtI [Thiobacillaceae bacterium]
MNPQKTLALSCLAAAITLSMASGAAQAGPTLQFGDEGSLTFTYALQAWAWNQDFKGPGSSDENDLFLRRNRLALSGQMNDMIGFYAQLEGGGYPNADNDVFWRDAYITVDYSDALRLIVGEFKNTFSRENLEACLEPLTLDRSELLAYTPFGGTRDTGVALWGNLLDAKLQYRFMVAEGRDSAAKPKDNYRYTARVHYSFLDPEFNYGYLGTYLGTSKVFTVGAAYDYQRDIAYANYPMRADPRDYKAWTLDAFFEYPAASGVYTLSGAYFDYDSEGVTNQTPDPNYPINGDLKGYYLKAGYMLPSKVGPGRLQFFARHDKADYGIRTGLTEYYDRTLNSLGANYYLDGQKLKLTLEYAKADFDKDHPTIPALRDYSQLTFGLQFIF